MTSFLSLPDDNIRLTALQSYHILDTVEDKDFDDLTALAAAICQVPIALISLVDKERQWFKSHKGISISETPIEQSFCAHAIVSTDDITIIADAHQDDRFKNNPLVTGKPGITFYAGVPLTNEEGHSLGTLCVVDPERKTLSADQVAALKIVAKQVMDKLELRRKVFALEANNKALKQSEQTIKELNANLQFSNIRIRTLIEQAPVAIIIFRGENLFIEAVNPPMLELLGKEKTISNQPLLEAIPELAGQPPYKLLYKVYTTGETIHGYDTPVTLNRSGKQEQGYFNFTYAPLVEDGRITGVIDMAVEVTEQVVARQEVEKAEALLRLTVEAAKIGTWNIHPQTKALRYNNTLARIFGYEGTEPMTYEQAIAQVTNECRDKIINEIEKAIADGGDYDITYTQKRFNDGETIYLRSLGKVTMDTNGKYTLFSGVVMDVTEQKQDDQRKNDFISMVSHELKTPLTSIKSYLQILQHKARKGEDTFTVNALDKANNQVQKMTAMINGFLNVSRLEAGKIHIDNHRFDMAVLIKEVEEEFVSTITTHHIIFEPVNPIFVYADQDKISHVISNLISNALKYSPNNSTIEVACITNNGMAQLSVKDHGIGIAAEDTKEIFDRFYRVKSEQMQSIAGFGIGLYLCKEIIDHHHGEIWVTSEPGKGSTFFFTLPVVK